MHQLEDKKQSVGLHCRQIFAIRDYDFRNANFTCAAERLVQKRVCFFAALLRFEEIRLVEKFWIHLVHIAENGDIDRVGGFYTHPFEIFIALKNVAALLLLEGFYELI